MRKTLENAKGSTIVESSTGTCVHHVVTDCNIPPSVFDFETDHETEVSIEEISSRMPSVVIISSGIGERPQSEGARIGTNPTAGSSTAQGFGILPLVNKFHTTMKPAQLPCFMVEDRLYNREFWSRESILEVLDDNLLPKTEPLSRPAPVGFARPTHLTFCGQGGLGKSEIAINFVFTRREKFDAIFWVRADDPGKLEEGELQCNIRGLGGNFIC